ncbi:alpha/beta hydrolase family protein [Roseateles sp. UC29_93]|uniref:alpha/beta hydrolase family protein n=1 Tax=Roseateles sp. UC29_93 TaxID=3350177 RepID=UPI00366CD1A9
MIEPTRPRPRALARSLTLAGVALLGAALLLAGCGGGPPKARIEEQQQQREFASRGYAPQGEPVTMQPILWRIRGDDVRVSLTMPASMGATAGTTPRPVVVYLPGLGESDTAGIRWRRAWAAAGYAVLSLQALDDDATAWSSELARSAEFTELGRRHYADAQMRKRLARLDELLAEAQRLGRQGQGQGDPPWRSLDWSKTVVAGYELGAQTAMAVAGERQSDGSVLALKTVQPVAAIVISPQVFASPDAARYRDISIPVLGLTGPDDSDVLGLVRDVQWRQAPFAAMPAGRGWLLSANEVRHAALGGNEPRPEDTEREQKRIRAAEEQAQSQPQGRRGGGGRGGRGQEGPTRMAPVPAVPDYRQLHEQQLGMTAAQQVSVAFLDQQLKQSEAARAWLAGPVDTWLGALGSLRRSQDGARGHRH